MTTTAISFEVKSQLAKLLATENITMQHSPSAMTAFFDIKNRLLVLPMWQNISEDLYDMLVVHEVGHALDTPNDKWMSTITDIAIKYHNDKSDEQAMSNIKDYLNIIEDARIERRQKIRYPGSKRNFVIGYKELYDRNFFGIQGKDVNSLSFMDRANIYFKNGAAFNIQFTPEEKSLIKKMESTQTFDDVIKLTDEIYGIYYAETQKQLKMPMSVQFSDEETDEDGESMDIDMDIDMDSDENEDEDEDNSNSDSSGEDEKTEGNESGNDKPIASKKPKKDVMESVTEKAAREAIKTIVIQTNTRYVNVNMTEFNMDLVVDDYKTVIKEMDNCLLALGDSTTLKKQETEFLNWRQKESDTISFMVKEFEMRKSADTYSRQSIAKTGVIDMNKLHSYKYNDDIFRRLTVVPQGKNHGFVMFVDWSGSMSYVLHNTLKQVFTLALFCNRVQIPFEVYSFRTTTSEENYKMTKNCKKQAIFVPNQVNIDTTTNFKVRNLLSSRMKVSEMNKALKVLWTVGHYSGDIQSDPMTSTPLNSTIMVADKIINNFRTKYKLQIVNTVILTDGASDPICFTSASGYGHGYVSKNDVAVLRDPITKKTYSCGTGYQMTNTLLRVLKDRTNCNLIGFYLAHSLNGLGYMFDSTILHSKKVRDSWKNNKFVGIKTAGYDEYYITQFVDGSKPSILNIDPTMKPRAITKEFARFSEKKTVNRMMLKSLMDRVSQDSVV